MSQQDSDNLHPTRYMTQARYITIPFPVGVKRNSVDGSEMTLDPSEFLLEHKVKKSRVEFADFCAGSRHFHRFLSAPQHDLHQNKHAFFSLLKNFVSWIGAASHEPISENTHTAWTTNKSFLKQP